MTESARPAPGGPILILPIIDWEFRSQRPQHLARSFAKAGHPVLYPDLRLGSGRKPREVEPGIFRFQLRGRGELLPYREPLTRADADRALEGLAEIASVQPLQGLWIVVHLPAWLELALAARRRFSGSLLFDCMDSFEHFDDHGDLSAEEAALAAQADVVSATAIALVQKLAPQTRSGRVALVRNGCEPDRFVPPPMPPSGRPVIGYFGGIHEWFDGKLLAAVASARPDWSFRLIGDTHQGEVRALRRLANVEFVPELPYDALPAALASWHVGVIPFEVNPLTAATDPVKLYEMLALGLPVVSTPLPEAERFRPHVRFAADPAAFTQAIADALADPPSRRIERRRLALNETWCDRYNALGEAMNAVEGASPILLRDLWRERAVLVAEARRLARRVEELESQSEVVRERLVPMRERPRRAGRRVAGAMAKWASERWWLLRERYWGIKRRLRRS